MKLHRELTCTFPSHGWKGVLFREWKKRKREPLQRLLYLFRAFCALAVLSEIGRTDGRVVRFMRAAQFRTGVEIARWINARINGLLVKPTNALRAIQRRWRRRHRCPQYLRMWAATVFDGPFSFDSPTGRFIARSS